MVKNEDETSAQTCVFIGEKQEYDDTKFVPLPVKKGELGSSLVALKRVTFNQINFFCHRWLCLNWRPGCSQKRTKLIGKVASYLHVPRVRKWQHWMEQTQLVSTHNTITSGSQVMFVFHILFSGSNRPIQETLPIYTKHQLRFEWVILRHFTKQNAARKH